MQEVWKDLFKTTLFITKNEYVELKKGQDGEMNYVEVPTNMQRFLALNAEDKCHNLKPLYYNSDLNVLVKPRKKTCGCNKCDCSGLCDAIGGLTVTTKEVVIDNVSYTEYLWLKICPNGDIMEYRTIPTTVYTFYKGSYEFSYDYSYEIGGSNSETTVYNLSRKLCNLEVKPCGCPVQNDSNKELFFKHCGCFLSSCNFVKKECEKFWGECNWFAGEIKFSECGTKIYVKHVENFEHNQWLVLSYQVNGVEPDSQVQVPDYAKMCMFAGVDYYKKVFNNRYNQLEKTMAFEKYEDEKQRLVLFNNLLDIEWMEKESNQIARW